MITLKYQPYQRKAFNIITVVQEIILVIVNILLIVIKDQSLNSIVKDNIGWTMIGLFLIIALINLYFVLKDDFASKYQSLRGLWEYIRNRIIPQIKVPKRIYPVMPKRIQ